MTEQLEADVAIVGAGLAGLVAARRLAAAGKRPLVMEARERVGGRLLNEEIGDGKVVEVGGQWIGPTQERLAALAAELGVGTFPTHDEGRHLIEMAGRRTSYTGALTDARVGLVRDLARAISPLAWPTSNRRAPGSTGWRARCRWRNRGWRRRRRAGTARPSPPGSGATPAPRRRAASSSWRPRRSGRPSPATSRSSTSSSTRAPAAASTPWSGPAAAPSRTASTAARSGWRC